ncbi:MAG TPA: VOC family protein [Pyrinomonadaceae bacterium]|nr:VOC family protein [Pyrinomonadaceae bacterium]
MARNNVGWFEIYVDDMARARAFYEAVIGVTLSKLEGPDVEMYAFPMDPEAPGSPGSLVQMPGFPAGGNSTLVYFSSEDCAVEESRVEQAGGRIEKEKFSIGEYGFVTLAHDTEGNMFGIHSMS